MADKEPKWHYEKLNEKGQREWAPPNDPEGKHSGIKGLFGFPFWLDENPEERKRLGWIKHIEHSTKDIEYDHATQYLVNAVKRVDDYTVEDDWKIMDMSPEQMRLAELDTYSNWFDDGNDGIAFMR